MCPLQLVAGHGAFNPSGVKTPDQDKAPLSCLKARPTNPFRRLLRRMGNRRFAVGPVLD
jgi:hypothetical protein